MKNLLFIPLIILLAGCNPEEKNKNSGSMVLLGENIYNKNCSKKKIFKSNIDVLCTKRNEEFLEIKRKSNLDQLNLDY